jgi:hypothetical protein
MNMKYILTALSALIMSFSELPASEYGAGDHLPSPRTKDFREALKLHQRGMHSRASFMFDALSDRMKSSDPEGYSILADVMMDVDFYESVMNEYLKQNPHSVLASEIKCWHGFNLFDDQDYAAAAEVFADVPASHVA